MYPNNNPKVPVVVSSGVACHSADDGVDVAVADLDELQAIGTSPVTPMPEGFRHLLERAGLWGEWPAMGHYGCGCGEPRHPMRDGGGA